MDWNGLFVLCPFFSWPTAVHWKAQITKIGPVELSRMQRSTLDLIWSLMGTHREPQMDLILPQHATIEVPNTVSHYISSYFHYQTKHHVLIWKMAGIKVGLSYKANSISRLQKVAFVKNEHWYNEQLKSWHVTASSRGYATAEEGAKRVHVHVNVAIHVCIHYVNIASCMWVYCVWSVNQQLPIKETWCAVRINTAHLRFLIRTTVFLSWKPH